MKGTATVFCLRLNKRHDLRIRTNDKHTFEIITELFRYKFVELKVNRALTLRTMRTLVATIKMVVKLSKTRGLRVKAN